MDVRPHDPCGPWTPMTPRQQELYEHFHADHDGLYVHRDFYVQVKDKLATVLGAEFYIKTKTGWKLHHEAGFSFML